MKRLAILAVSVVLAGPAFAADPLEGLWRTVKDDNGNSGLIQVKPCGSALCGTLIKAYGPSGEEASSDVLGTQIISATRPAGDGAYKGKIYSPDRGKTYNSRLQLTGNTLKVSGCVLGICRDGGTWKKVK